MKKHIVAAVVATMIGGVGNLGVSPSRAAHAAPPATPAMSVPLYQANWSEGLGDWSVYRGFAVANGMLTFDGNGDNGAFAPFHLHGMQSFAVEATIQVGTPTRPAHAAFYLFARRSIVHQTSGIFAGYDALGGEYAARNVADFSWHGDNRWYFTPASPFRPDAGFHTYRIEVQATAYRLLIDGRVMVPWTEVQLPSSADQVGLIFTYIPATVRSFAVYGLPQTPVSTGFDTNVLLAHSLPVGDIPYPANDGVFRDNARYASDNRLLLGTVHGTGRIYGYLQSSQDSRTYIEQSINLHTSPAGAQAAFDLFSSGIRRHAATISQYQVVSTAGMGIGDGSFAYRSEYQVQGAPSYVFKVLFYRGDYYVAVTVDSANPNIPATAMSLAQKADALVQP